MSKSSEPPGNGDSLSNKSVGQGERSADPRDSSGREQFLGDLERAHDVTRPAQADAALRESEERYRLLFHHSPVGVFHYDLQLCITDCNERLAVILQSSRERLAGLDMKTLKDQNILPTLRAPLEGKEGLYEGLYHATTSSAVVWISLRAAPLFDHQGNVRGGIGIAEDITEYKQAEEALRRQNEYLTALQQTTLELVSQLDLNSLLQNIVKRAGQLVETSSGFLDLVEPGTTQLQPKVGLGALAESLQFPVKPGEGIAGTVWQTGMPLVVDDYDAWSGRIEDFSRNTIRSIVGVPLLAGSQVLGVLGVAHDAATAPHRPFGQADVELLTQFARLAAVAVENARLFGAARQHVAELEAVRQASLSLTSSLDLPAVLDAIAESTLKLLREADDVHIYLYEADRLVFGTVMWSDGRARRPFGDPRPHGLTYAVARQGQPIVVPNSREHPLFADAFLDWKGAIVGLPLKIGPRVVGVMNVGYQRPRDFPETELRALRLLADQAALAVENARLYQEVYRHAGELGALIEIGRDISATLDLQTVLERIAAHARDLLEADDSEVYLLEPDGQTLRAIVALGDYSDEIKASPLRLGKGIVGTVAQSGVAEVVSNVAQDPRVMQIPGTPEEDHELMCAPLISKDHVIGVMALTRLIEQKLFSQSDLHYLVGLARQAVIAIENARLYEEVRRRASKLSALIEIGRDISGTLDLPVVLERIAAHARDLLEADDSEVYLLEPDGQTLRAIVALGQYAEEIKATTRPLGEGIVGSITQKGVVEVVNHVLNDPRAKQVPGTPVEDHALIVAPLTLKGQVIGAMALTRYVEQGPFSQADMDFLTGLARQATLAIENARLYAIEQQRTMELGHALEQQKELDRLKNQFIQNVSHELRTPLAIIRGYAELLEAGELGALGPEQQEPIKVISRRVRMLGNLVDNLTAIIKIETSEVEKEPVDLAEMARAMLADFRVVAEKAGLTLTVQVAPNLPLVSGDVTQLRRVLDNLLGNALKFTPAGGTLGVRLEQEGAQLILQVSDTGIGIPPDKLGRIFERFYQVDGSMTRRYSGVGLGLALVKEIVQAHGGTVSVVSTVGKGSQFRVALPLYDNPSPSP